MSDELDISRHRDIFDPDALKGQSVDIIGCGATGSRIAISLAKLGVKDMRIWDGDLIEPHNIANQIYGPGDIWSSKTDVLSARLEELTNGPVDNCNEKFVGQRGLHPYVFLLTDTMSSRREIWEKSIKMKLSVKLMIETRMGVSIGRVYNVNPCDIDHVEGWEATLYDDDAAELSVCGTPLTVGATAELVSGYAVWSFINHFAKEGAKSGAYNELIFSINPLLTMTSNF